MKKILMAAAFGLLLSGCAKSQSEAKFGEALTEVHFIDAKTGNCIRSGEGGKYTHFYLAPKSECGK